MHSLTFTSVQAKNWRVLYRVAIQETDRTRIPERIFLAERAVLTRARELFRELGTMEEKDALEDALYLLRAFRSASTHLKEAA
jgi:hypothetical protein